MACGPGGGWGAMAPITERLQKTRTNNAVGERAKERVGLPRCLQPAGPFGGGFLCSLSVRP